MDRKNEKFGIKEREIARERRSYAKKKIARERE